MESTASFGKRRVHVAPKPAPKPVMAEGAPIDEAEPFAQESPAEAEGPLFVPSRVPFLALGLIAALALVFAFQGSLVAKGAVNGPLVLQQGQWWRLFTAPFLDGDPINLGANLLALLYAGWIFEPLIGRRWFAALFAISALGGSLGSLAVGDPDNFVSGAAGAVMGLLAAAFVCSYLFESEQLRLRMQRVSLRLLMPSLLPALLPLIGAEFEVADYSIQVGGAVAGALMGFVLHEIWPEDSLRPDGEWAALAIAAGGAALSACSLALIALR